MTNKSMRRKYSWMILFVFLAACGNQRIASSTDTPMPTVLPPTPVPSTVVPTSTSPPATAIPTPSPAGPVFPVITPDAMQIERWNEYEEALAKAFFKSYFQPEEVVCEWEILGQAEREVYVWAYCSGIYSAGASAGSIPAVIHLGADGSVQSAEIPGSGTAYGLDIQRMFPPDLHQRIFDHLVSLEAMNDRSRWRRGHPDEPPLVILNSLTAQPTQPVIPWVTPDPVQVEKWRDYENALAADILSYLPPENVLCEWEILGRSGNEVYVWAVCGEIWETRVGLEGLAIIYLRADGSVEHVLSGMYFPEQIRPIFPPDVQERYFGGQIHFQELVDRLRLRLRQSYESPLIVLRATPTP
jgi:hypothetical protein